MIQPIKIVSFCLIYHILYILFINKIVFFVLN